MGFKRSFVTFDGAEDFTYPKTMEFLSGDRMFPSLNGEPFPDVACKRDVEDSGDDIEHPVIAALAAGGVIEDVEVGDEWEDDHCTCINVEITVSGLKYGFSAWWLSPAGYRMFIRAEDNSNKKAVKDVRAHILSHKD